MKTFFKAIGDMFLDQNGGTDEKRVLGFAAGAFAFVYIGLIHPGDFATFTAIGGYSLALLGISVAGDQGKLG
jgi:hypothetical protein